MHVLVFLHQITYRFDDRGADAVAARSVGGIVVATSQGSSRPRLLRPSRQDIPIGADYGGKRVPTGDDTSGGAEVRR